MSQQELPASPSTPDSGTGVGARTETTPPGNDLPPVTPPSAGFILQLFVVPALIVLAVVALWTLFGRLAAGEQDWRALAQDMESTNPHIYRRAMFGMAQLLDVDRRRGTEGQQLASNPEVARSLAGLLQKQLESSRTDADTLSTEVYLSRALGLLDVPADTLPVLNQALDAKFETEVRKGAVTSVAMIAGRAREAGQPLDSESLPNLLAMSSDSDPSLRRAAAFTLGLFPDRSAQQQLLVLLEDAADFMTAVNAAIALSRSDSPAGYAVLLRAVSLPPSENPDQEQDRVLMQRNALKAISELSPQLTGEQRAALRLPIGKLAETDPRMRLRIDAQAALSALDAVR